MNAELKIIISENIENLKYEISLDSDEEWSFIRLAKCVINKMNVSKPKSKKLADMMANYNELTNTKYHHNTKQRENY